MRARSRTYFFSPDGRTSRREPGPREVGRRVRLWHAEAMANRQRLLGVVGRKGGPGDMVVGVGDRRGIYLLCNYGKDGALDRFSVGPGGLRGRRKRIEFDYGGDPHEVTVQCLVPVDVAINAIELFLKKDALPLTLEWVSDTGITRVFEKRPRY